MFKIPWIRTLQTRSMHLLKDKAYINGQWLGAQSGKVFQVTNPATGEVIGTAPDMDTSDTQRAIEGAHAAFQTWQDTTAKDRSHYLRKWYDLMAQNHEDLAKIITLEAGKPLVEARGEVAYGNSFIEFFSEEARRIHGEIIPSPIPTKKILVERQPIGVAGLIAPWNFPHAMITRKAGAALASGCTCVIKPAEDTPFTALALMELAHQAGIPSGVVNVVTSSRENAPAIGNLLCESPLVAGISFTGSTQVGKLLYRQCSSGVKRLGLELGGNAPFIVFNSANVGHAVKGAMASKFRNCGQTCVSSNRFLVQGKVYDSFVGSLVKEIKSLKIGNGQECGVNVGPLINQAQFGKVSDLVEDAVSKGAKVLTGGKAARQFGELFYEPTVLTDIKENMRVYTEEVFGPIVTIFRFETEEEGLQIANSTERGLAGYFYSEDVSQIFRVARKLEVGMCGVNEGIISTAEAPFGGIKESGLGREGSHHGIDDFTYIKYICVGNL
ncbi:glutarate-semialdehyde dehydrogenase [Tribolium castaneum]|uniref:Succinate-semialdehyde dehydrogenase n=1 Tax=Tribolium castaneum TaxID=7070 RepID=D6X3H7_TRICA|nr:PREDICTED: glutarate-semialdehyde dehydrogenase DavD [Tribolium castaneum]EEZ97424.1 Glutarate-semialdehyde dehydrogenase DavD-like Protein [Tribolium castaneum]|eukprot:XP_972566.1 PREDICTED: glutarate-semialdehyde dehydrogenase DavD [Tribolium castaneum]